MDLEELEIESVREDDEIILMDSAGTPLARIAHADDPEAVAFAERLEACWRICHGMPTETIRAVLRFAGGIGPLNTGGDHAAP